MCNEQAIMLFQQPAFRTIYDENRALFMVSIVNKSFTAFNAVRSYVAKLFSCYVTNLCCLDT